MKYGLFLYICSYLYFLFPVCFPFARIFKRNGCCGFYNNSKSFTLTLADEDDVDGSISNRTVFAVKTELQPPSLLLGHVM